MRIGEESLPPRFGISDLPPDSGDVTLDTCDDAIPYFVMDRKEGPRKQKNPKRGTCRARIAQTGRKGGWSASGEPGGGSASPESGSRPHAPAREMQSPAGKTRVGGAWMGFWFRCFGTNWRSPPGAPCGVEKNRRRKVRRKIRRKSSPEKLPRKEGNMEIVYPHSEDPNTSERDELLPFMDAKNYLLHEPEQPGLEPGGRGVSLDTQLTFTQVSVQWQDTDSMREELDDLQVCKSDFLKHEMGYFLNLHVEMFRVNKYPVYSVEDILQVLIVFAVESLELDFALLFPERHILLRVLPVLVVLATRQRKIASHCIKG
ncbi:Protein PIR [Vitis vinifera]|uniref:Protein PIR n=1 Tax=Vitis vinifera TaxID=29760 RepID=A0A438EIX8_VITVI|nr:Protein PIR [Vitis vinifera]